MQERDSCYFCTSSYQLFAIIALAVERKEKADLYIDPQFIDADVFANRIRATHIFENVVLIDSKRIYGTFMSAGPGLRNHFQIANTYLHVKDIAKTILLEDVIYDNLFLSSKAYIPRMVQMYFIQAKRPTNFFYFDDGAGSYENNRAYRISIEDRLLRTVIFGTDATKTDYKRFLFSPEVYYELNKDILNVNPIGRLWNNQSGKALLNNIFGVKKKPTIKERVIILDQPKEEIFSADNYRVISDIYHGLVQTLGYENVIVKKHPRSSNDDFKEIKYFESPGVPFELFCLNMSMNKKIIVAHSSTAAATPKILFDQEPTVIVLSKLIEPVTGEKNLFVDFFNAVKSTYRNQERFLIPNNVEELTKTVNYLG